MDHHSLLETVISRKEDFRGSVFSVETMDVRLPNGATALREAVRHNGGVAIVALDEAGDIAMVRQHRVVIDEVILELPAGKLEGPEEDPLEAAKRELEEETGLRGENWRHLITMYVSPGYCSERLAIYLATGITHHHPHTDADEFLAVETMAFDKAYRLAMEGVLEDGKTALGIIMAWNLLHGISSDI